MVGPLRKRVSGHALSITLVVSIVLGVLTTTALSIAYFNRQQQAAFAIRNAIDGQMISAIHYVLHDTTTGDLPEKEWLGINLEPDDTVLVQRYPWGLYLAASLKVSLGPYSKQKCFLYGAPLPPSMNGCLYVAEHNRGLSLSGNTLLQGDAYIPKAGLQAATVDGRGFEGRQLIEGQTHFSDSYLPPLPQYLLRYLSTLTENPAGDLTVAGLSLGDSVHQSFAAPSLKIHKEEPIYLEGVTLQGHILIQSDTMIDVSASCRLDNVILTAPIIRFGKGFTGSVQAFASDSLLVAENCQFAYPTALVLSKRAGTPFSPLLRIGAYSKIAGLVVNLDSKASQPAPYLMVESGASIKGIVYASGYLSLKGAVAGCVLTDFFSYGAGGGVYENYLVDVNICRSALSTYFAGPPGFFFTPLHIVQWVP